MRSYEFPGRKLLSVVIALALSPPASAIEIVKSSVEVKDGRYIMLGESIITAPRDFVFDVLAESNRTHRQGSSYGPVIIHIPSGEVLAQGRRGWQITPFEGNFYISRRALRTKGFAVNWVPGLWPYKFLYLWMNFVSREGERDKFLGWKYVIPNPLFPFIWFRVGVPQRHPLLRVEEFELTPEA